MVARKVPLLLFLSLLSVGGNASRIFVLIISLVIVINARWGHVVNGGQGGATANAFHIAHAARNKLV